MVNRKGQKRTIATKYYKGKYRLSYKNQGCSRMKELKSLKIRYVIKKPKIEGQTTQWSKVKGQKDKQ